jgi:hypothetical protein
VADTFQGTVESLLRVEDHDQQTILDFKLRSGLKTQRVKSRLEVADWIREGDLVEASGKKDNEGVLVADKLTKIAAEAVPRPRPTLSGRFLIGLCFLMLVSYNLTQRSSWHGNRTSPIVTGSAIAFWMVLGAALIAAGNKWKASRKIQLLLQAPGAAMIVAAFATLVEPNGNLVDLGSLLIWLLIGTAFVYALVRKIARWTTQ